jgi:DNA topoisomerase-1
MPPVAHRPHLRADRTEVSDVAQVPLEEHIESAAAAGLRYVTDTMPGIRRERRGKTFVFIAPDGQPVLDDAELKRFASLVIPPAWTDVWICASEHGHLQVTARDARGRKQYRYHPVYRRVRDETKFGRMLDFSEILQTIRERVERVIMLPGHSRVKVLATLVSLLEKTLIRVGTDEYAKENGSYGLTTMKRRHVAVKGATLRFEFKGKSGVPHTVAVTDRRIARIVQRCQELPGQELFQYLDDDGRRQSIDAVDINDYLREISGGRDLTAKDFRTWAGTMLAAKALRELGPATTDKQAKANIVRAIDEVAKRLGNTRAVCRKYYVHPALLDAYMRGETVPEPPEAGSGERRGGARAALRREEAVVLECLQRWTAPQNGNGASRNAD